MIVEPTVNPAQPGWPDQAARPLKPAQATMASFHHHNDDTDPDPPPAAPAARPWPRVFPGL